MKLLVGVDGSPSSFDAVRMVSRVVDPAADTVAIFFSSSELQGRLSAKQPAAVGGIGTALFEEARGLLPLPADRVESISSTKAAAVGILESARDWKADMIAVGARGTGPIGRLLVGSVSRAVVHGAHLPVLVVRRPPSDDGLRVLVAHKAASASAVAAVLARMHWPQGSEGRVIGVTESMLAGPLPEWIKRRSLDPDIAAIAHAWEEEHEQELGTMRSELAAFERSLPPPFQGREPIVVEGNPGEQIMAAAERHESDLVVVGRTPADAITRWLIGSTSEAVLSHGHTSVLLVPVER